MRNVLVLFLLITVSNIVVGFSVICPGYITCKSSPLSCTGLDANWEITTHGSATMPAGIILLSKVTGYENFPTTRTSDNLRCEYDFAKGSYVRLQPVGYESSHLLKLAGNNWQKNGRNAICKNSVYSECYLSGN